MLGDLTKQFEKVLEEKKFNGTILIALKGKKVFEKAYGFANIEHEVPNKLDTKFRIASISKSMTACAILKLIEEGVLKFDTTLKDIIPDYPNGEKITIHHILANTSGLAGFDLWGDFHNALTSENVIEALIDMFKFEPFEFEPGEKYDYSNSGYLLLGYIIEKVTGLKYADYLNKEILNPLGIFDTGFDYYLDVVKNRANGYDLVDGVLRNARFMDMQIAGGGGALYSTVNDIFTWNENLIQGKIISQESLKKMTTSHVPIIEDTGYGYGWFVFYNEMFGKYLNEIYHTGGGPGVRSINAIYTDYNLQIIMLSNINDKDGFHGAFNLIEELCLKDLNK